MKPLTDSKHQTIINPKVVSFFDKKPSKAKKKTVKNKLEGCLSIPRIWAPVKRRYGVNIEYSDLNGNVIKKTFTGYQAIIVQHEIDHLDGILFTQRAIEQKSQLFEEKGDKLVKITSDY